MMTDLLGCRVRISRRTRYMNSAHDAAILIATTLQTLFSVLL